MKIGRSGGGAAEALGEIGYFLAAEALISASKDKDQYVRWKAEEALRRIEMRGWWNP